MSNAADAIWLTNVSNYAFRARIEQELYDGYKKYLVYTKPYPPLQRAVIISHPDVLLKEYPLMEDTEKEEKMLEDIILNYHKFKTEYEQATNRIIYRTAFGVCGAVIGTLFAPLIGVFLGVSSFITGWAVDVSDPKSKRYAKIALDEYIAKEAIICDEKTVAVLRKEAEKEGHRDIMYPTRFG